MLKGRLIRGGAIVALDPKTGQVLTGLQAFLAMIQTILSVQKTLFLKSIKSMFYAG